MPHGINNTIMNLEYTLLQAGHCTHYECVSIKGGRWKKIKFPAICAIITHPQHGHIIYDTGYSPSFHQHTQKWPFKLYRKLTPVTITHDSTLHQQLINKGISTKDIHAVIVSHFHADHIGGLTDFPQANIICSRIGWQAVKDTTGFKALLKGYLPAHVPEHIARRMKYSEQFNEISLKPDLYPFKKGYDIFGDRSMLLIALPGHAQGQLGLLFTDKHGKTIFLVADSCWSSQAYKEFKLPTWSSCLVHDNRKAYIHTLKKLHLLYQHNPDIVIIPSHCQDAFNSVTGQQDA